MKENPFIYLQHSSDTVVENWYRARKYVLNKLNNTLQLYRDPDKFPKKWHFIVDGDSELMLSVVRHLALYAHFMDYEDYDTYEKLSCINRTLITIVSKSSVAKIRAELEKPEYLGNLPKYCHMIIFGEAMNQDSYIDIAINIVNDPQHCDAISNGETINIKEDEVLLTKYKQEIDTFKAVCAHKAYMLGDEVSNLSYEDIFSVSRYSNALSTFKFKVLLGRPRRLIDEKKWKSDINAVRSGISNVFCSDCFEIRKKGIQIKAKKEKICEEKAWKRFYKELSYCEHNRWVVEKLILGYEPFGIEEIHRFEHLFGDQRNKYLKNLKNATQSPKHLDICSNRELRRRDPDSMKYDSFLMLAIPMILRFDRLRFYANFR